MILVYADSASQNSVTAAQQRVRNTWTTTRIIDNALDVVVCPRPDPNLSVHCPGYSTCYASCPVCSDKETR